MDPYGLRHRKAPTTLVSTALDLSECGTVPPAAEPHMVAESPCEEEKKTSPHISEGFIRDLIGVSELA